MQGWLGPRGDLCLSVLALAEGGRGFLAADLSLLSVHLYTGRGASPAFQKLAGGLDGLCIFPGEAHFFIHLFICPCIHSSIHPSISRIYNRGFCLDISPGNWGTSPNSAEGCSAGKKGRPASHTVVCDKNEECIKGGRSASNPACVSPPR